MRNCVLHQLNTSSSVVGYYVPSDIWLTMLTIHNNSIISTLLNSIPPHQRHAPGFVVISYQLHAVFMTFINGIVKDFTFVVLHFNADAAYLYFILDDVCINI